MNAGETKLQPVLEGTKQYVVPLFQRSYSWKEKDWTILWDDIAELCQDSNPRNHFIGSIVTMPASSVPQGISKFLLIDGQQRLTTIFILLALLRDKAKQTGQEELAQEIEFTLLVNQFKRDFEYYKLLPSQGDRASFHNIIRSESTTAEDRITDAYHFFERKLRRDGIDIQTLMKVIANNLSLVSIVLDPDDNPYLVFESLNAKGEPLTQGDLIRNFVFMRVHVDEQDRVYSQYWKPMQDALNDDLTEFIRHYLMKGGASVKQSDVYFSLKEIVGQGDTLEHLKDLTQFAKYYEKLLHPEKEENNDIRQALYRINRLEVTTGYPFLLNCYHDYDRNEISDSEFVDVLKTIENYIVRRFVCNIATKSLNRIFPPLYSQVQNMNPKNFVEGLHHTLQTKEYPKNTEFKSRWMDVKLYGSGDRATKARLILESIEESYDHKEQVPFNKLSIEHVMPQTLTNWWRNHLGEGWEETHELLLHTIGNLTLTAYNQEMSNDTFENKKDRFRESHLEMNKYFLDKSIWKREDIEKRSEHLAELALSIWPYFGDEKIEDNERINSRLTVKGLWILGQHFPVESWRDVLEQTMNTIAELEPEKFEQIVQQYPRFIGRDKDQFRVSRELKNGVFIKVHFSGKDIRRFCFQAIEAVGLTSDDWKVDVA